MAGPQSLLNFPISAFAGPGTAAWAAAREKRLAQRIRARRGMASPCGGWSWGSLEPPIRGLFLWGPHRWIRDDDRVPAAGGRRGAFALRFPGVRGAGRAVGPAFHEHRLVAPACRSLGRIRGVLPALLPAHAPRELSAVPGRGLTLRRRTHRPLHRARDQPAG